MKKYFNHGQNTRLFQVKNNSATISKMKNEKKKCDENTSFMMNVKQFKNMMKQNNRHKMLNTLIQNFENLFHQEFSDIKEAEKILNA